MLPKVGNTVQYLTSWDDDGNEIWKTVGKVMGFGTSNGEPTVLVALDEPFWSPKRDYFVTVLSFHMSSIRVPC